jgi:hypothetical protein
MNEFTSKQTKLIQISHISVTKEELARAYQPENQAIVFEINELKDKDTVENFEGPIMVTNTTTKNSYIFDFIKADINADDIAGWNYISRDRNLKLLLIND